MIKASIIQNTSRYSTWVLRIRSTYLPNVVLMAHPNPAGNTRN